MADLHEVEQAIVSLIAAIVYPSGTGSPSAINTPVKIYRGWPEPNALDADLAAGTLTVSIFPTDTESKVTRHQPRWIELPVTPPTFTLTASGNTVTVSGTPSTPANAAVLVDGKKAYVYPVQAGNTLTQIAAGLAMLIAADYTASSTGAVITVVNAKKLVARVGGFGTAIQELKRQKRGIQITLWCNDPAKRDTIANLIDVALADVPSLSLPDGTAGRMLYERSRVSDKAERDTIYRRDLFYSVEYSTTKSQTAAQVVAELLNYTTPDGTPLSSTAI